MAWAWDRVERLERGYRWDTGLDIVRGGGEEVNVGEPGHSHPALDHVRGERLPRVPGIKPDEGVAMTPVGDEGVTQAHAHHRVTDELDGGLAPVASGRHNLAQEE